MNNILMIRCNAVNPDPRVEKEANALIKHGDMKVDILAWDRSGKHPIRKDLLELNNGTVRIFRMGIPAQWGNGMKSNILPAIEFEIKSFIWLFMHVKQYDCVHAYDLLGGLPSLIPAKLFGKKFVYDCCDYYADSQNGPEWILNVFRKLETFVINSADETILCTEDRIKQIVPAKPRKVEYIHNAPDLDAFKSETDGEQHICLSSSDRIKLVYVGNFCSDRWIIELLQCAVNMQDEIEIHIGGFGSLEEKIHELSKKANNIYVYGKLPYKNVLQLERECDVILALYEPRLKNHVYAAPNKVYEALAIGKPLLMFRGSDMSSMVENHHIGILIDPTAESFKKGISEMRELLKEREKIEKK